MNLGPTRLRGRPRNRWQNQVREEGRVVGGEGWQEKNTQQRGMEEAPENGKDRAFCTCQSNEWCNIPKH